MAGQHFSPVTLLVFAAFFGLMLFRRFRRTVGRQPLVPKRLMFQVGMLGIASLVFLALAFSSLGAAAAALGGLIAGGAVGLLGLNHTRFERGLDRDYFTPNTYLGLAVFGLFLGRLVYRYVQVSGQMQTLSAGGQPAVGLGSLSSSPLTAALLLMVFGYYLVYESGLLLWVRQNPPGREIHGGFRQPRPL